jgi:hypothetical protein
LKERQRKTDRDRKKQTEIERLIGQTERDSKTEGL